eukprot:jgi/Botrbrau1/23178/Bobra.0041s0029.1
MKLSSKDCHEPHCFPRCEPDDVIAAHAKHFLEFSPAALCPLK